MKIIHCLNHFLPQQVAGTEIYVWSLCKQLQLLDIEVSILIPHYKQSDSSDYIYDGIKVHQYAEPSVVDRELITGNRLPDGLKVFKEYLQTEQPDIVHFHALAGSNGLGVAHFEAAKSICNVVFTVHLSILTCNTGTLMFENKHMCDGKLNIMRCSYCSLARKTGKTNKAKWITRISKPLYSLGVNTLNWQNPLGTAFSYPFQIERLQNNLNRIIKACDVIIPVAEWYQEMLSINGVPREKMVAIRQALPIKTGNIRSRDKTEFGKVRVLYVGRIDDLKGVRLMIEAAMDVDSERFQLDIYGSGPDGKYISDCQKLTSDYKNIRWMGSVSPDKVMETMCGYDALILPSMVSEMAPLVIQEAFSAKIPVIGSNVHGIAEMVKHNETGLLFEFGNKASLFEVFHRIINEPELMTRLSLNLPAVRDFQSVANETLAVYKSVAKTSIPCS